MSSVYLNLLERLATIGDRIYAVSFSRPPFQFLSLLTVPTTIFVTQTVNFFTQRLDRVYWIAYRSECLKILRESCRDSSREMCEIEEIILHGA